MRHKLIALVVLGSFAAGGAQNTTRQARALLVRMNETELSMRPTAGPNNVGNCLVVAPDGGAHLELRRQEFFSGRSTQATYEGTLNAKQLDILQTILGGDAIRSLPRSYDADGRRFIPRNYRQGSPRSRYSRNRLL